MRHRNKEKTSSNLKRGSRKPFRVGITINKKIMKNLLLLTSCLICSNIVFGQITNPAPYCIAGFDANATVHYISRVVLGTLDNNSGTNQWPSPHYVYYNNLNASDIQKGSEQTLTVNHDGGASTHFIAAWIDFNQNNTFEESEKIMQKFVLDHIPNPIVTTFTVPLTASTGITRMRVMVMEDDNYTWIQGNTSLIPCTSGTLDWGETEDYNVNILLGSTSINESFSKTNGNTLYQNYPNPFLQKTTISFSLEKRSQVSILIYDVTGNLIYSLKDDYYDAGEHSSEWNSQNNQGQIVIPGVYFYQLRIDGSVSIPKEMIILK